MDIGELGNKKLITLRTGRAGRTGVDWQPWRKGRLYVARRVHALKRKGKQAKSWKEGAILTLAVVGSNTVEYSEDDYQGNGVFNCEDYYLEIEDLH